MHKVFTSLGFQKSSICASDMLSAASEERYRYTMDSALGENAVWCLTNDDGDVILNLQGTLCVCIWPSKQAAQHFANFYPNDNSIPREITLPEFKETVQQLQLEGHYSFAVYPTQNDAYIVTPQMVFNDFTKQKRILKPQLRKKVYR